MPRKETKKQFNEKDRRSFGPGGSGQSAEVVANQRATRSRRSPESATNNSEHGVVNANEKTGSTAGSPTSSQLSTTPHKQDMLGADLAERQSRATLSGRVVRARRIFDPSPSRSPPSGRSRAPSTSRPKRRQTNAEIAENLARTAFRDEDNEQPAAEDETHNSGDPDADQPGTSRPDQQLTPAQRAVEMNRIVAMRIAAENSSDDSEFAEFRLPDYEEDDREESSAQINELVEQCEVVQNGRKRKRMAHFESSSDEEPEDPTQPDELLFQTPSIPAKVVRGTRGRGRSRGSGSFRRTSYQANSRSNDSTSESAPPNQTPIRGARRGRPRGSANRTITPVRAVLAMNDVFSPEISDEETNPAEESQPVQEAESIRMTRSGRSIRPRQMLSPEPEVRRQKDTAYRDHNALAYQQFEPRVFYYNGYRFQMAYPEQHNLGPRNNVCPFCNAIHFDGAHVCCRDGKVFVPPFKLLPQPLDALFTQPHDDVQSFVKEIDPAEFFTNVLHYNALFAFASICYNRQRVGKHGVPAVKIQGRSLHLASTLHPREGAEPAYANFYVFDRSKANQLRMQGRSERGQKPQKKIVEMLEKWFEENNPFARGHRRFKELINEDSETTIQYRIVDRTEYKHQLQGHKGIYAGPETLRYDEFVSVFYDASIQQTLTLPRGITIHAFFKGPRDIKPLKYFDHTVNALAYPLLFPYGESTWGPKRYELVKPAPFLVRMLNYLKEQKAIGNDTIEKDVGWQEKILEEQIKEIERQQKEAERAARSSGEDAMDEEAIEDNRPESEDSDEEDILLYRERIIQAYEADGHFESDEEYDDELVRETIENAEIEPRMEREEIRMEERGGVHYARRESVPIIEDPNIDLEFDSDEQEDEEDYTDRVRIKIADDPFNLLDSDDDTTQNPENDARAASGDVSEDDLPGTEEAAQVPIESRRFKRPMIRPESSIDAQRKRVKGKKHEFASMRDWTLYVNQKRERLRSNRILGGRKLSQVFIIDMATRIQQQRLDANRLHHTQTLKTTKKNLIKHLQKQVGDRGRIGMVTWMPATYPGSPANLRRHFENAVTLSNALGQPDLFITITCNGSWPEIQENLAPNHNWADEPFLVAEVFRKKIEVIIDTICGEKKQRNGKMKRVGGLFGGVAWYVYSVEFQQRGLPHIHMVVSLEDHIKSTEEIDSILSAELPPVPPPDHPQYEQVKCFRENVQRMMIHTPCAGNPKAYCRKEKKINPGDGLCTKKFPKSFNSATEMGNNTYVKPRRREGEMCQLKTEGRIVIADNRYVIAHNPSLLMKLGCHSNVEIVTDLKILKYIFKYIYKGFDRVLIKTALQISHENPASGMGPLSMDGHLILPQTNKLRTFDLKRRQYEARQMLAAEGIDEVDDRGRATLVYDEGRIVQDMRAMTAIEGAWEIAGYGRFGSSHIVETNFIHLPNEEPVIFEEGKEDEVSVTKLSRLDAWFALNGTNDIEAKKLTFNELPKFYKWRNGEWKKYKRNISERKIGRVKSVHPRYAEKFAVRLLTMNRTGIKSFTELRTTVDEDGVEMVHETFAGAAKALRLMDDEREWDRAIKEAAKFSEPATVRRLFSYIVLFCAPRDPLKLWNENKEKGILLEANKNWSQEQLEAHALHHIQKVLTAHAYKLKHLNLPKISTAHLPPADELEGTPNDEVDIERFKERSRQLYYMMNSGQKKALDTIITELNSDTPKLYFLNGSAGTGKTFVYEALYNELRSKGKNVTTVAHTGIAATLLQGGKTVHRTFGVPVNIDEQGACQLDFGSNAAQEINDTDILIWDESPMTEARIYQAVDRLLGDITTRKEHPFGGKTIIFGGDWKQTLPIVPEEGVSGSGIIAHLLPSFVPFGAVNGMQKLELQQNMRAKEDPEYIKLIESVGRGENLVDEHFVKLPEKLFVKESADIIEWLYGNQQVQDPDLIKSTCILTIDNANALLLNQTVLDSLDSPRKSYKSIDAHCSDFGFNYLDPEIYNQMTPSGMPPHELNLKINAIVILLTNLNTDEAICNGSRFKVIELGKDVVICKPLIKTARMPETVAFSRIYFKPTTVDKDGLAFSRLQFPLRLAYAMTVNKSQGQGSMSQADDSVDQADETLRSLYSGVISDDDDIQALTDEDEGRMEMMSGSTTSTPRKRSRTVDVVDDETNTGKRSRGTFEVEIQKIDGTDRDGNVNRTLQLTNPTSYGPKEFRSSVVGILINPVFKPGNTGSHNVDHFVGGLYCSTHNDGSRPENKPITVCAFGNAASKLEYFKHGQAISISNAAFDKIRLEVGDETKIFKISAIEKQDLRINPAAPLLTSRAHTIVEIGFHSNSFIALCVGVECNMKSKKDANLKYHYAKFQSSDFVQFKITAFGERPPEFRLLQTGKYYLVKRPEISATKDPIFAKKIDFIFCVHTTFTQAEIHNDDSSSVVAAASFHEMKHPGIYTLRFIVVTDPEPENSNISFIAADISTDAMKNPSVIPAVVVNMIGSFPVSRGSIIHVRKGTLIYRNQAKFALNVKAMELEEIGQDLSKVEIYHAIGFLMI